MALTADDKSWIAEAVAAAVASQASAGAGASTARTSENTEHSDRTRATTRDTADRGRSDSYTANQVDSDIQATEALQDHMLEAKGRNRTWFDVIMSDVLADARYHRTTQGRYFTNLFTQADEREALVQQFAEALAPVLVEAVKNGAEK